MSSLKKEAQYVLEEARDAICWFAVWKEGRSWHIMTFWPEYDEPLHRFTGIDEDDLVQLQDISSLDPRAIFINGYYYNLGSLEEMTQDTLANAIRWHYEDLQDAQLSDTIMSLCGGDAE